MYSFGVAGFIHDWLGKYYNVDWRDSAHKEKLEYRKIGKTIDMPIGLSTPHTHYHIGLYYAKTLGYWGVSEYFTS